MSTRYTVWAPAAQRVEVVRTGGRLPMAPAERAGWWEADAESPGDGRYGFSVDGSDPRPDPRSRRQPDGVHGLSQLDDEPFTWTDAGWAGAPLRGAVYYELHVGTFTDEGTFAAAIERLGDLVDLGVTVVELMPVAAFPGHDGWGYDGVSLFAVHEPYGGPAGLRALVDAAHALGLGVCLDVVLNHLGPSGNYLGAYGPYFTDQHHTPWGDAVNLDAPGSDEVRAFLRDVCRQWLADFHVDALRLDAVHALRDDRAVHLLEELSALADDITARTGVPRTLIAESDRNDPATVTPRGVAGDGGLGLHGQWVDDVHHALHVALTGETQGYYSDFAEDGALAQVLATPFRHAGEWSTFRGRSHGRPVDLARTPPERFVASLQTHDQVGNRAVGERLAALTTPGRLAIGAALLLTAPWTPMLFMGEEWAASTPWQYFTDHAEPELVESIRRGRQAEFAEHGWGGHVPDPQAGSTVRDSTLRWEERDEPGHRAVLDWYRALLRLRREHPGLLEAPDAGGVEVDGGSGRVVVDRGEVVVVANLGPEPVPVPDAIRALGEPVLAWDKSVGEDAAELGVDGVRVWVRGAGR